MQFTEKETNLAKQLKEAGLPWKPVFGDMVLVQKQNLNCEVPPCGSPFGKGFITGTINLERFGDIEVAVSDNRRLIVSTERTIWLPLWKQCREFLAKKGWFIGEHYDSTNIGQVSLWIGKKGLPDFDTNFKRIGETDLEAMYKVLLEVIKNVNDE